MTISYNWLCEYLPASVVNDLEPEKLSRILTSLGLEVESLEKYESIKGSLKGLIIGEVVEAGRHPNAEKLSITRVSTGQGEPLQIVCGAPNVAKGQKVVVATVGTTIYPQHGDPMQMKVAKIRGEESHGMICAEDEIGLGDDHAGIIVLPENAKVGQAAAEYFKPYTDWIYEVGLTPNRMDAMSHLGVARDVCAYLTHHNRKEVKPKNYYPTTFQPDNNSLPFKVVIENKVGCQRYSGISVKGVIVKPSPGWMQNRLKSIGVRPINNIVDITNYVLHETGQPLHAFDADQIKTRQIVVKNLPEGSIFHSLDDKERKLSKDDLMICDGEGNGLCIAGVFGGIKSGVKSDTTNIFLESAWFNPVDIRKTSFRHQLRTDAATHFEKNVDISNTVNVLKRAALLIRELAGGELTSDIIDVYPDPKEKSQVQVKFHYLRKLSGKNYHPDTVKKILVSLGFDVIREGVDEIRLGVPFSKPDISLPADIVEEIMRVDGYDNIDIPHSIMISPSTNPDEYKHTYLEKISNSLVGLGFSEIITNSITNSAYFDEKELKGSVKMLNSLTAELNMMRPSMLETGAEVIAHNLNRKNLDLKFFEFGKTYATDSPGRYQETEHISLYVTGQKQPVSWKTKPEPTDIFYVKGILNSLLQLAGLEGLKFIQIQDPKLDQSMEILHGKLVVGRIGKFSSAMMNKFDLRQPVFFGDIAWEKVLSIIASRSVEVKELPRQLPVLRDLAMVVEKSLTYGEVEQAIHQVGLKKLIDVQLFDVFESDKLGEGKKSLAVSFSFLDEEKTMTEKEINGMMQRIMEMLEKEVRAEIRTK